jgi:hypothetical protein
MFAARAVVMLIAIVLLSSGGVFSQEKKDTAKDTVKDSKESTGKVKGALPKNWSKLGLSDMQKQEVYKIHARFQEQIDKLNEQLSALKSDQKKEMEKVLTPEQKKRLVELLTGDLQK